jgi:phosphonate transport system ATP-binding protein
MIELRDVWVRYPSGLTALEGIDLTFRRGQFTVLIGPSGAGKSTLLRCLNMLIRPTRGMVAVDGLSEVTRHRRIRDHRRSAGMIFQQHHLIGRYTALQNVLTGRLGYHPWWRTVWPLSRAEQRLALECLERVGLLGRALDRAENLSGGEQQRVGIARALAQQPRLLLADEPVASLDPATAGRVLGLMHTICREDDLTCVVALHQLDHTRRYADRIVALNRGRVVFDGIPALLTDELVAEVFDPVAGAATPLSVDTSTERVPLPISGDQVP